jgi:hypothetical protein
LIFVIVHGKASVTSLVSSKLNVARVARSMYSVLEGFDREHLLLL